MAFFEKLGDKISSGANAVTDSAKKITESNRINSKIKDKINQINNQYVSVGMLVKQRLVNSIQDEEVLELCNQIDSLIAEIDSLQIQLNTLKGIKVCPQCKTSLDNSVQFCVSCGARQPSVEQPVAPQQNNTFSQPNFSTQPVMNPVTQPSVEQPVAPQQTNTFSQPNYNTQTNMNSVTQPVINPAQQTQAPYTETVINSAVEPVVAVQSESEVVSFDNSVIAPTLRSIPKPIITPAPNLKVEPVVANILNEVESISAQEISQPQIDVDAQEMPKVEIKDACAPMPEPVISNTPPVATRKFIYCSHCGKREDGQTKFCSQCGSKF